MTDHVHDADYGNLACPHSCCDMACEEPGCNVPEGTCCAHCGAWHLREVDEVAPR